MVAVAQSHSAVVEFTEEELSTIHVAKQHFWFFLEHVYALSFTNESYRNDAGEWVQYAFNDRLHQEWAMLAQYNPRLCLMAPRLHLKTTVLSLGFAFWHMFRTESGRLTDIMYFSYKAKLAEEKVADLKRLIEANPFCRFWKDKKVMARTQINYLIDFGEGVLGETSMQAQGILGATRGRHPKVTICDDILSDFANPLSQPEIEKITRVFRQAIMSLPPNATDPLILVGTPQSYEDVLHLMNEVEDWLWLSYPAIIDELNQVVQWPEKFNFRRLKQIQREVGPTAYEVEYQLTPVQVTDQFFTREDILTVIDAHLMQWPADKLFDKTDLATYGGFDVGRFVHPSHAAIFLQLPGGTLVQLHSRFMDQMRYNAQVKALNEMADNFRISRGYFDATYNALEDRGLRPAWRGRSFSRKLKADMSTLFEKRVVANQDEEGVILLNDLRQMRQIVSVNKELKAAVTVDGHGDAFWSIGLAIKAAEDGPGITNISSAAPMAVGGLNEANRPGRAWIRQLGGPLR